MRDTRMLHPDLQKIIPEFLTECSNQGLKVRITECLRTVEEQNELYAQGRTKVGAIVTNCQGNTYSSPHQWGIAFDFCRNDGKGAYTDTDSFFKKVGKIGETMGLQWGGDWKSFVDKPHLQIAKFFDARETVAYIKSKYSSPDDFKKSWSKINVTENWGNLSDTQLQALITKYGMGTINMNVTTTKDTNIKLGDKGDMVKLVQLRIAVLGYECGTADGICGAKTVLAIKNYQLASGLAADGIVGKNTWFKLMNWRA